MIKFIFSIFLFLSLYSLFAEEVIRGIRYLKPNASFSEVSDLYIQNGVLSRIIESKQKEGIRYVLPSFCDAHVTLGANATGGQNSLNGIRTSLKSLVLHGFTHIQSIADGPWIYKIKSEIDSGKMIGPRITISNRPLIPKSAEVKDVSDLLYFTADNKDSTLKEFQSQLAKSEKTIHIFNRYNEDASFSFDSELLHQLRLDAREKNKILTIYTFADRISILDALISGNRYLAHPILFEMQNEIAKQHIQELNLIPLLNVYRNMQLNAVEEGDGILELEFLKKKSKFFLDNYSASYESALKTEIEETELENRKSNYSSFLKFIEKNPILKDKMILGSGAGNHLSFPGISGIQELKILAKILKPSEGLFLIPTRNSCSYLGTAYNGTLAVGKEANLLILKENPVKNIDALFQIEQVIQNGKLLRFDSLPAKKLPKKK
jgi:hypothetical protein